MNTDSLIGLLEAVKDKYSGLSENYSDHAVDDCIEIIRQHAAAKGDVVDTVICDNCGDFVRIMGDASTRKDEATKGTVEETGDPISWPSSPAQSSEISVVDEFYTQEEDGRQYLIRDSSDPKRRTSWCVPPMFADEFKRLQKIEWCVKQQGIDLTSKREPVSVDLKKIRKLMQACGSGDSYSGYSITEQELVEDLLPALGVMICK